MRSGGSEPQGSGGRTNPVFVVAGSCAILRHGGVGLVGIQ